MKSDTCVLAETTGQREAEQQGHGNLPVPELCLNTAGAAPTTLTLLFPEQMVERVVIVTEWMAFGQHCEFPPLTLRQQRLACSKEACFTLRDKAFH